MQPTSKNLIRFYQVVLELLRYEKLSFWCVFSYAARLGAPLAFELRYIR
jgi:hypothetical protein